MTIEQLSLDIEALVFASERALTLQEIHQVIADMHSEEDVAVEEDQVRSCLTTIQAKYDTEFHSFTLKEIGGGFQFLTKPEYHRAIAKLNGDKFMKRLSTAAMETLAIIAYKQPITKGDIEYVRGVSCDYSIQKLLEKELIVISGRNEEAVGKPLLYSTSKNFMDYLGLNNLDDLPRLQEIVPNDMVVPTNAEFAFPDLQDKQLVVDEGGTLVELEAAADSAAELLNTPASEATSDDTQAAEQEANQANGDVSDDKNSAQDQDSSTDDIA
jgi:segregation and condensation protein B